MGRKKKIILIGIRWSMNGNQILIGKKRRKGSKTTGRSVIPTLF